MQGAEGKEEEEKGRRKEQEQQTQAQGNEKHPWRHAEEFLRTTAGASPAEPAP